MTQDRFCRECGLEFGDAKFCPGCGTNRAAEFQPAPTLNPPAPAIPAYRPPGQVWGQRLQRVFSIRIILLGAMLAGVAGYLASLLWEPLAAVVVWPVFIGFMLLAMFNDENVIYCPHCRKRVKIGAASCHHCGRAVR